MSKNKSTKNTLDVKVLSDDKIISEIMLRKKELMSLRFKSKLGELSDTSLFKKAKLMIARLYTELGKRKRVVGK
jgi:ribosomal protein L29